MDQALKNLDEEGDEATVDKANVYEYYAFAWYSTGDVAKALRYTDLLLELQPDHPRATGNKVYYEEFLEENEVKNRKGDAGLAHQEAEESIRVQADPSGSKSPWQIEHEQYQRLCRGEGQLDEK